MDSVQELKYKLNLSKAINITRIVCFVLLMLLAVQPMIGLFINVNNDYTLNAQILKFKAYYVKVFGWLGILAGFTSFTLNGMLYGYKFALRSIYKNPWNILFICFLIWGAFSFEQSQDKTTSWNGYAYPYEGYSAYLSYWGIYFTASALDSKKLRDILLKAIIYSSAVVSIVSMIAEFTGQGWIISDVVSYAWSGTFINPNHLGYYLCVATALSFGYFVYSKEIWRKVLFGGIYATNLVVMLLNGSFGSYLALIFALFFIALFALIKKERKMYVFIFNGILFTFILSRYLNYNLVAVELPSFFSDAFNMIKNIVSNEGGDVATSIYHTHAVTADGRIQDWGRAVQLIKLEPLHGYGVDMAPLLYVRYFHVQSAPHNEFLSTSLAMGIPAGVLYFSAIIWIIIRCFRKVKKLPTTVYIAAIGMGTYAVSSFFGITLPIAEFIYFIMLGLVNSHFLSQEKRIDVANM